MQGRRPKSHRVHAKPWFQIMTLTGLHLTTHDSFRLVALYYSLLNSTTRRPNPPMTVAVSRLLGEVSKAHFTKGR
jgi:hypothetical protein